MGPFLLESRRDQTYMSESSFTFSYYFKKFKNFLFLRCNITKEYI